MSPSLTVNWFSQGEMAELGTMVPHTGALVVISVLSAGSHGNFWFAMGVDL